MDALKTVWDLIWAMVGLFAFIVYIIAVFSIIGDLIRDRALSGWARAAWLLFLIVVPFLTALVYLIVRGSGMAERAIRRQEVAQEAADDYIRAVAGTSPAEQIAQAKKLLDDEVISREEFDRLKTAALAGVA